jgi:trk system potassium uptake protein TrkA
MHIVIAGGGEFGLELARELVKKYTVTVIDKNQSIEKTLEALQIEFLHGNCANTQVLHNADLTNADYYIACTDSDEINIISCWTAKQLTTIETICFVKRLEYIESLRSKNKLLGSFGLDHTIWPKKSLADDLEKIVSVPAAIDVEIFARGKVKLFEYRVKDSTKMINTPLKNCQFPEGCIIVGVTRENELHIPDGNTVLNVGDKVIFMGTDEALKSLSQRYFKQKDKQRLITIIGGGTVGFMLAQRLEKEKVTVVIIENNYDRCEYLANNLKHALILNGDGTDLELLQSEQIGQSDVLVSVTNNDEKNLLCSLLGKQLGVNKVLTRVEKTVNMRLFETVGIDVALSPKASSINEVLNITTISDIDILAIVDSGRGEVLELIVSEDFEDTKVKDLNMPFKAIIGAVIRSRKVIVPKGDSVIQPSDRLIVFTTKEDSTKVLKYFQQIEMIEELTTNIH